MEVVREEGGEERRAKGKKVKLKKEKKRKEKLSLVASQALVASQEEQQWGPLAEWR